MKRIIFFHHSGTIGGAGVSLYNTIISLKEEYEIIVYCPSQPNAFKQYLESKDIKVKTYDFSIGSIPYYSGGPKIINPLFAKNIINIFKCKKCVNRILNTEKPDLIIVNSKILAWISSLAKKHNIKSICYVRETRKNSLMNIWNYVLRFFLQNFTGVIFISQYDQDIERLTKIDTCVVPNYLDTKNYQQNKLREKVNNEYAIPQDSFNILFVGGMWKIKGYDVAIKSLKYLNNYNVKLIVAGDPSFHYKDSKSLFSCLYNFIKKQYENKIDKIINRYELRNKIIKIGICKEMNDAYTLADVLIFPANTPHQARPVFEAGIQKVPVIMPDYDNTLEYVIDGENGLIFKAKNPKSLSEKIIILINNEDLRRRLGENNYKSSIKNHRKESSEKILKSFIKTIIGKE